MWETVKGRMILSRDLHEDPEAAVSVTESSRDEDMVNRILILYKAYFSFFLVDFCNKF